MYQHRSNPHRWRCFVVLFLVVMSLWSRRGQRIWTSGCRRLHALFDFGLLLTLDTSRCNTMWLCKSLDFQHWAWQLLRQQLQFGVLTL